MCWNNLIWIDEFHCKWRSGFSHPFAQEFVDGNGTLEGTRAASSGRVNCWEIWSKRLKIWSHFFLSKVRQPAHLLFLMGFFHFQIPCFFWVGAVVLKHHCPIFFGLIKTFLAGMLFDVTARMLGTARIPAPLVTKKPIAMKNGVF